MRCFYLRGYVNLACLRYKISYRPIRKQILVDYLDYYYDSYRYYAAKSKYGWNIDR